MRDSCIFYRSFYEAIKELPMEEQGQIYNAIFEYALDFKEQNLKGICKTVFTLIKPQLDANIKRFNNGNIPKTKQEISKTEANDKQKESKTEANNNVNVNLNENVNLNANENENIKVNKRVVSDKSVHPSYGFIKSCYLEFYLEKTKSEYYFDAKDGYKINSIIKKLLFKIKEKNPAIKKESESEEINKGFKYLLSEIKDPWILSNLSLSIIDSKFNEIINQILNPKINGQQDNNEERRKEILAKYAN